jgi:hypothetical protein
MNAYIAILGRFFQTEITSERAGRGFSHERGARNVRLLAFRSVTNPVMCGPDRRDDPGFAIL